MTLTIHPYLFISTVLVFVGCASVRGPTQLPIRIDPVDFVDSVTGQVVGDILVIPRYSSFAGISTGAGHGPSVGKDRFYLSDPFRYYVGGPFSPTQPASQGILWGEGWAFAGKGRSLDGVLVLAPGYRPLWVYDLWGGDERRRWRLEPMPSVEAAAELKRILGLLDHDELSDHKDYSLWSLGYGYRLEIRFTEDDRQLVRSFLSSAITSLESELHGRSHVRLPNYSMNPTAGGRLPPRLGVGHSPAAGYAGR